MAWPSTSARTKTWGTEILTSGDLDGQFDILHSYNNDQLNGSTGHGHTGSTNDGPKLNLTAAFTGTLPIANGGTNLTSYTQGDVIYASASNVLSKAAAGTAGQALTTGGSGGVAAFAGMTTQGDVEYHNGTTRTRLGAGTAGMALISGGAAANPSFAFPFRSALAAVAVNSGGSGKTVTGLGFKPVAIIFMGGRGPSTQHTIMCGAVDSALNHFSVDMSGQESDNNTGGGISASVIKIYDLSTTIIMSFTVTSMDSGGFTYTVNTSDSTNTIYALAMG